MFSRQPFTAEVEMPVMVMELREVRVEVRPRPIDERVDGNSFGCVAVDRALAGGGVSGGTGRMDGYSCWTDLNGSDDESWYMGVAPNTETPLNATTVKTWLQPSGPKSPF
jgi:hypothetical protein